ncbi:MAG: hypothetical protein U0359_20010 [Byssovorax sp.]
MATDTQKHRWRFFRAGGFDQVRLDSAEDLLALDELDQKLWVALACPTQGLELDPKTLELIDTDKDGRIRPPELIAAVKWAGSMLKDAGGLTKGAKALKLADIDASKEEGKQLLASAKQILKDLGKKEVKEITVEDTADTAKIFAQTKLNGDGVVPPGSAEDDVIHKAIEDVIACAGSDLDRSGAQGVTQERVDKFFTEAAAFADWWAAAEKEGEGVLPLGEATTAAAEAVRAVKAKVEDYFARCRLAAFDARAAGPLNRDEAAYAALASKVLDAKVEDVIALPLAKIEAGKPLPLGAGVNPAWAEAMEKLHATAIKPLLGEKTSLSEADWAALLGKLAPFEAWQASKPPTSVEKLGLARIRELRGGDVKAKIDALIADDKALEPAANAIASVDKLVRYNRDLYTLLNNFVSFREFYGRKKAVFQAGTLYLDGKSCDLCVKVADAAAHAVLGVHSKAYLAYCECTRKATGEKMTIAAAVTGGDADNLMVGRNGIFYDRAGHDWDATVVKLVEQPISIRQAFWLPYKRVAKLIDEQIEKFASSRDKEMQDKAAAGVADTAKTAEAASAAPPAAPGAAPTPAAPPSAAEQAFDVGKFAGIFAAIGLAVGAIGSALAAMASGLLALAWWKLPLVLVGVLLLISGPSMLLAALKLRHRSVGPILDGNGWAVNASARLNIPFGGSLTAVAELPKGAEHSMDDPFAEKSRPWGLYIFLLLVICAVAAWKLGYARTWLDELRAPPAAAPAATGAAAAPAAPK